LVKKVLGPLDEGGNGILFFIDVSETIGLKAEIQ